MLTIPEVVEKLIKRSPFLSESLAQGIINISALARNIKPEIEKEVQKNIQTGALVMAGLDGTLQFDRNDLCQFAPSHSKTQRAIGANAHPAELLPDFYPGNI